MPSYPILTDQHTVQITELSCRLSWPFFLTESQKTLTPSLPWCHLKATNKRAKFETLRPFRLLIRTGMWTDFFLSKCIALKVDVSQDRKIYCLQARPCIFQPRNFTVRGSEGVETEKQHDDMECFLLFVESVARKQNLALWHLRPNYIIPECLTHSIKSSVIWTDSPNSPPEALQTILLISDAAFCR